MDIAQELHTSRSVEFLRGKPQLRKKYALLPSPSIKVLNNCSDTVRIRTAFSIKTRDRRSKCPFPNCGAIPRC